jgi:putative NADH-flavin reductase
MKVAIFGATGNIGSAVTDELLRRGHVVTAVTRSGGADKLPAGVANAVKGDVREADTVAEVVQGHDAVVSTVGPTIGVDNDREIIVGATHGLIEGLRKADVKRLVVLGGAGTLRIAPDTIVLDSPHFPDMWKDNAFAQKEALEIYRGVEDLDWTFVSPAMHIEPGERTGTFRVGGDDVLFDDKGESNISIADYAIAFVDELEAGNAIRRRITVAY